MQGILRELKVWVVWGTLVIPQVSPRDIPVHSRSNLTWYSLIRLGDVSRLKHTELILVLSWKKEHIKWGLERRYDANFIYTDWRMTELIISACLPGIGRGSQSLVTLCHSTLPERNIPLYYGLFTVTWFFKESRLSTSCRLLSTRFEMKEMNDLGAANLWLHEGWT